eukprot:CAMPEP_0170309954 /NCGR_PEP_ID=MMETSP0116_2-20130129/55454_1 /TAXON_ID=400756 /ORGANISM="Durinskia baltica, Strain CSIRO CS-38" /LENGTH=67 /DNA_ID=CAMNT_0010562211 /DNA_START=32 /DNA_END=235 /DNA_ORIENTATION=-
MDWPVGASPAPCSVVSAVDALPAPEDLAVIALRGVKSPSSEAHEEAGGELFHAYAISSLRAVEALRA